MNHIGQKKRTQLFYGISFVVLFILSFISLNTGSVKTEWSDLPKAIFLNDSDSNNLKTAVIKSIRLPRLLTGILVGCGLAAAGAALQGLFRNPLADPGLIGISGGSAVGAILSIALIPQLPLMSGPLALLKLPLFAMLGGFLVTFLLYRLAQMGGHTHVTTLLLGGIAINALAGAVIGGLLTFSTNEALREFTFWTLGSLQRSTWMQVWFLAGFILIPLVLIKHYSQALNAMLLGESEAFSLGFDVDSVKRHIIILCAAMVGSTVAFCGLIGFIGLVIPHLVRMLLGPDHRRLIPASMIMGANLLIASDLLARTISAPIEIPIGVLTSLLGAPFFIYLIWRRRNKGSWT